MDAAAVRAGIRWKQNKERGELLMHIRKLKQEEHIQTRPLYEEVFSEDSRQFVEYYYTEKAKDNQIYVAEEDEGIRSMLHLNPYQMSVNGTRKQVHYIVAVATQEAYRKRGYMAALLKQALQDMYQSGETFTFLMPASESIYRPFDFRTVYEQNKPFIKELEGWEELSETDCSELADRVNAWLAERYQVYALRDEAYYRRLRKEYACDGAGVMVRKKDSAITDCAIRLPEEEKTRPKIMTRIVDARRMLMSLRLKSLTAVCFTVTDPLIEENNRCLVLTGTEYSGVMLMDADPKNSEGTLPVSILTSLVFGACSVEEALAEEGVTMSDRMQKEWEKIIPLSKIYINETV